MADNPSRTEAFIGTQDENRGLRLFDANGDGLDDLVRAFSGHLYTYLNNEDVQSNLLTQIRHPQGANATITYKATPLFRNESNNLLNPKMPMVFYAVSKITNTDGLGSTEVIDFEFSGGEYYFNTHLDRKFTGFGKVVRTKTTGEKTTTFYHQGNTTDTANGEFNDHASKIGKSYRIEQRDNVGNLYSVAINKWEHFAHENGANFVKLARTVTQNFDGNASHKDKAVSYIYDNQTGNETEETQWGEVSAINDGSFTDLGDDKLVVATNYATNPSAYIVGLPSHETVTNHDGDKVAETRLYYDDLAQGAVSKGNLTKEERWKEGSSYIIVSRKEYDSVYGLVTREFDGRGNRTDYAYDTFNLYPTTITNALSQTMQLTYDYSSGQIKRRVDPNGRVFETVYDGFDRILEEKQPDINSPSTLVTKTRYIYTDQPNATSVKKIDFLDGNTAIDSYTYLDGFGRNLQERKRAESNNQYAVRDFRYNSRGLMEKESLPYFSDGTARTPATTNNALYTSYVYDALDRIQSVTNSVGMTTNVYADWQITVTDSLGKSKTLYKDAFDRLARVDEKNGLET